MQRLVVLKRVLQCLRASAFERALRALVPARKFPLGSPALHQLLQQTRPQEESTLKMKHSGEPHEESPAQEGEEPP